MSDARENPSWQLRPESAGDEAAIAALNESAFGPGRFAKAAYRLREGVAPVANLSFVATEQDVLRGSVRFWPIRVGGHETLLLGPLAVETAERGRGIGIALMQAGIEAARRGPWDAILLVGDEPYYAKVGFSRLPPGRVKFPGPVDPSRILGLSLKAGGLLNLSGEIRRAGIDEPVCADGAGVGVIDYPFQKTNFGLWSAEKLRQASELLNTLGVRYEAIEEKADREVLEEWCAWDEMAPNPHIGFRLWIFTADLPKVGLKIAEMFPERKF